MHAEWLHDVVRWMNSIQQAGMTGCLLFIGLYALCCLLFIPGSLLTVAGGVVYGFWGGCALVLAGNGLGSVLSLLIARCFLRDWLAGKVAGHPRIKALEKAVAEEDWKLVFLTRLSPVMPFSLINYSLGLTDISPWRFLLATELGAVPATCLYVYTGTLIGNLARIGPDIGQHGPVFWAFEGFGLLVAIGVTVYVIVLTKRKLNQQLPANDCPDRA